MQLNIAPQPEPFSGLQGPGWIPGRLDQLAEQQQRKDTPGRGGHRLKKRRWKRRVKNDVQVSLLKPLRSNVRVNARRAAPAEGELRERD